MTTATKVNPVEAFLNKVREDGQIRSQIEMLKTQEKTQAIQEIVPHCQQAELQVQRQAVRRVRPHDVDTQRQDESARSPTKS